LKTIVLLPVTDVFGVKLNPDRYRVVFIEDSFDVSKGQRGFARPSLPNNHNLEIYSAFALRGIVKAHYNQI
jgi:hypothetical protein